MNEIKHTPGPWHWDDTVWDYDPEQQSPWLVDENDDWVLCGEIKCNEANARLIAAAPELLESLMAVIGKLEKHFGSIDPVAGTPMAKAYEAIAKATGS
jgi:hypothetical protein